MPIDGKVRKYTWNDVIGLILKDVGLKPNDRDHNDLWCVGGFIIPETPTEICIEVTVYEKSRKERLEKLTGIKE